MVLIRVLAKNTRFEDIYVLWLKNKGKSSFRNALINGKIHMKCKKYTLILVDKSAATDTCNT